MHSQHFGSTVRLRVHVRCTFTAKSALKGSFFLLCFAFLPTAWHSIRISEICKRVRMNLRILVDQID